MNIFAVRNRRTIVPLNLVLAQFGQSHMIKFMLLQFPTTILLKMAKTVTSRNPILQLDLFSRPLPAFSQNGQREIKTWLGTCLSILSVCCMLAVACLLGLQLKNGRNPTVSEYIVRGASREGNYVQIDQIAFGVHDSSFQPKDDPDYVELKAGLIKSEDGKVKEKSLDLHKCSNEDLEGFMPINQKQSSLLDKLQSNEVLYCLNKTHDISLEGQDSNDEYQRLQIQLVACRSNVTDGGCADHSFNEKSAFLDQTHFVIYSDTQNFNSNLNGDQAIEQRSEINSWSLSAFMSVAIETQIKLAEIHDQGIFGQTDVRSLFSHETTKHQSTSLFSVRPFATYQVSLDTDKRVMVRSNYTMIGFLTEVSALSIIVFLLAYLIVNCCTQHKLDSLLLELFDLKTSLLSRDLEKQLQSDLYTDVKPDSPRLCCNSSNQNKLLSQAHRKLHRHLDIGRFMHSQRKIASVLKVLLNQEQYQFIGRFSRPYLIDNLSSDSSSSEEIDRADMIKHFAESEETVDKRMINMFQSRYKRLQGKIEKMRAEELGRQVRPMFKHVAAHANVDQDSLSSLRDSEDSQQWAKTATFGERSKKNSQRKGSQSREPVFLTLEGIKPNQDMGTSRQDKAEKETNETDFVIPSRKQKRQTRKMRLAKSLNINAGEVDINSRQGDGNQIQGASSPQLQDDEMTLSFTRQRTTRQQLDDIEMILQEIKQPYGSARAGSVSSEEVRVNIPIPKIQHRHHATLNGSRKSPSLIEHQNPKLDSLEDYET